MIRTFTGHNRLYRNDGDFRFTDITERSGLDGIARDSFTPIFADFDGDRGTDLYVPVDHRADLYYENRDGRFRDRSEQVGVGHEGNDMGVGVTDVDGDGSLDLFVTNIFDPEENSARSRRATPLLVSEGSGRRLRFKDMAYDYGVTETGWGWGAAFVDLDLDGHLELYAVQGFDEFVDIYSRSLFDERAALFVDPGTLPWVRTDDTGCEVEGDQRALLPFDFDRDGDVDLLITQVGLPVILLENRSTGGHWLTVRLDDRAGWGSGARVDVTVDGRTTTQLVMHGGSYLAGMPLEATFGLGEADSADRVEVTDIRGRTIVRRDVPRRPGPRESARPAPGSVQPRTRKVARGARHPRPELAPPLARSGAAWAPCDGRRSPLCRRLCRDPSRRTVPLWNRAMDGPATDPRYRVPDHRTVPLWHRARRTADRLLLQVERHAEVVGVTSEHLHDPRMQRHAVHAAVGLGDVLGVARDQDEFEARRRRRRPQLPHEGVHHRLERRRWG